MPHRQQNASLLTFALDSTVLAVEVERVLEVLLRVRVAPLPSAPSVVLGTINHRGALRAVIDLRARLGFAPRAPSIDDHFIVVAGSQHTLVLPVDGVREVVVVRRDSLLAPAAPAPLLRGVARVFDQFVLLQDLDALLDTDENGAIASALAAVSP